MVMFATVDELRTYAQLTPTELSDATARQALTLSSALVQHETRQHLARVVVDEVALAPVFGAALELPQHPVNAVESVVTRFTWVSAPAELDVDRWTLTGGTLLYPDGWHYFSSIVVTYDHGYDSLPDDLRSVVLGAAARCVTNPDGLRQETIGAYSRSLAGAADGLTAYERSVCGRYRHHTYAQAR